MYVILPQMVTIITGRQGIGKTTFILKLISSLQLKGSVGGIITPAVYDSPVLRENLKQIKTGFDALDIALDQRWPLGRKHEDLAGPTFGPFFFSKSGFERAISTFKKALLKPYDYIFLDEIGPLEFNKKQGFAELFPVLSKIPNSVHLYIVIRPSLIDRAVQEIFPGKKYSLIKITKANRNKNSTLLSALGSI